LIISWSRIAERLESGLDKTILLLDVDGVLIHAQGYRASVRAAFCTLCQQMGQGHLPPPTEDEMLAFEAENIIFEWDSLPLMLAEVLRQVPHLHQNTVQATLATVAAAQVALMRPDFITLARKIPKTTDPDTKPSRAALGTVFPATPLFMEILGEAHSPRSPITRLFQHYVLGDEQYARTYGLKPMLTSESLLEKWDQPHLSTENAVRISTTPHLHPIIYTARPSLPPSFEMRWQNYSPEAEIAQRQLRLMQAPLIGYGRVQWLARQMGAREDQFVKPSPVHSLVGIYSAMLRDLGEPEWEKRALYLAVEAQPLPAAIRDHTWRVIVFEDSYGSILGVKQAVAQLSQWHPTPVISVGIAHDPAKMASLGRVAEHVAPNINAGLDWALGQIP
jgi:hypothetical protein